MAARMVTRLFFCRAQFISQYMKQPMHRVWIIDHKNTLQWTVRYSSRGRNSIQVCSQIHLLTRKSCCFYASYIINRYSQCPSYIFQNSQIQIPIGKRTTCSHESKINTDYHYYDTLFLLLKLFFVFLFWFSDRLTISYSRSSGPGGQHVNKGTF